MPCPRGSYSSTIGALSSALCQLCSPGQYATVAGASSPDACKSCSAGSYNNLVNLSSCVFAREFTWLFRDPDSGFYYLNMPIDSVSAVNYGVPAYTYWSKVRIHSTLSQSIGQIQLYVLYVGNSLAPCLSSTIDPTYAKLVEPKSMPPGNWFTDFGSVSDCQWIYTSTRLSLEGTPFSILDQTGAWAFESCSWGPTMSVSCNGPQDCTAGIVGDCGGAYFNGMLGVHNLAQFVDDIQLACVLYKGDTRLSCSGNETMCYDPCTECSLGEFTSDLGATFCQLCPTATFSNDTGAIYYLTVAQ